MAPTTTYTVDQLKQAVQLQEQIDNLQSQLSLVLGGSPRQATVYPEVAAAPAARGRKPGRKPGRPAASASFAQTSDDSAISRKRGRRKRTMSPEAREKIAAAQRRRWAKPKGDIE